MENNYTLKNSLGEFIVNFVAFYCRNEVVFLNGKIIVYVNKFENLETILPIVESIQKNIILSKTCIEKLELHKISKILEDIEKLKSLPQ